MKRLLTAVLFLALAAPVFAQYTVDAGQDRIVIQGKDGQHVVNISSSPYGRERFSVEVLGMQVGFRSDETGGLKSWLTRAYESKGHLALMEVGWNVMSDKDYYLYDDADGGFMKNSWKSLQFAVLMTKISFDLDRAGATSFTMGWQVVWNTYQMSRYATLEKRGGIVYPVWSDTPNKRHSIWTSSMRIPFQFEINADEIGMFIAFGGYFGAVTGAALIKSSYRDAINPYLNHFEFGISMRIGWQNFYLYVLNQYTNLFMSNRGPMLTIGTVGIGLDF